MFDFKETKRMPKTFKFVKKGKRGRKVALRSIQRGWIKGSENLSTASREIHRAIDFQRRPTL